MRQTWKRTAVCLALAGALGAACASPGLAVRPGGDGGTTTTPYSLIELGAVKVAQAISDPLNGIVTIVGRNEEGAAYAIVDVAGRKVLSSGLLPGHGAYDVNSAGVIVGITTGGQPVRWTPGEDGYVPEMLPLLAGDTYGQVEAVNEAGEMVGTSHAPTPPGEFAYGRAAYWNAAGAVVDLSALLPEGSGWVLTEALDINTSGQVAGSGLLDGVRRGFVLKLATLEIAAVPLAPGATENEAWNLNDSGHVVGRVNDGVNGGGPFPQGGWGYFWGGPGTAAQLLPSTKNGAAMPRAVNNLDEVAGDCEVAGADIYQEDLFMSLWQPDQDGALQVTDLGSQIPTKPAWYLRCGFGINDDGWIAGEGRKFVKGKYSWQGVLLVPNL